MDKAQSEVKFPERENKAENLSVEPMRNHDTMDAQTGSQETPPHWVDRQPQQTGPSALLQTNLVTDCLISWVVFDLGMENRVLEP